MNCSKVTTICLVLFCFSSTLAEPGLSASSADGLQAPDTIGIDPIRVRIEMIQGAIKRIEHVSITVEDSELEMGGFDFLISYDAYNMAFIGAEKGQLLDDCDWEYFTYRQGIQGNYGDACPSGLLRMFAMAEINNGPNHPSCYAPSDTNPHELTRMRFLTAYDRNILCQFLRVSFYWNDCENNSILSVSGDTVYIDHAVFDFTDYLIWDEDDNVEYPEAERPQGVGTPDYCLDPDPEQPGAVRKIDFINGGIDFICADSIDGPMGDINLNGRNIEIADAAMFADYFIVGLSVFRVNVQGQIAASDVNQNGITLEISDLVALIRRINGDELLNQKLAPVIATIKAGQTISVKPAMAAAHLIVAGDVTPTLLANNMAMKYNFDGENTRILVYSFEKDQTFEGDVLDISNAELLNIELATYSGAPVLMKTVPADFALLQNYPNPFNPSTKISFAVPVATAYTLTIFNIQGQTVKRFAGQAEPGIVELFWDASDYASGIYFYRLNVENFADTRKMVLLK